MIDEHSLESRDFSIALPDLISKVQFIGSSLVNATILDDFVPRDSFFFSGGLDAGGNRRRS